MKWQEPILACSNALFQLFFPRLCIACHNYQPIRGHLLCGVCEMEMPLWKEPSPFQNAFHLRLTGRLPIYWASAYLRFRPGNAAQKILHELKYRNNQTIGYEFGKRLGKEILEQVPPTDFPDWILPVPLHPKKLHQRGYNQSLCIARGIAQVLQRPVCENLLMRKKYTETQTRKSRQQRIENVENAFVVSNPKDLCAKHVLLVDDVFTSGATTEACAEALYLADIDRLSVATLALAEEW